jgi:hypothetical protein
MVHKKKRWFDSTSMAEGRYDGSQVSNTGDMSSGSHPEVTLVRQRPAVCRGVVTAT